MNQRMRWMSRMMGFAGVMGVAAGMGCLPLIPCAQAVDKEGTEENAGGAEAEVLAAAGKFYEALNQLFTGELGAMEEVWSHSTEATYMGPAGGIQVGWTQVRSELEKQAAMKLGGKLEASDMHVTMGPDQVMAVVSNYEKGENKNVKGESREIAIRATNVFRKEGEAWKMVGHHVDLLPFMKE